MKRYQIIWQEYLHSGNRLFDDKDYTKVLCFGESAIMADSAEEVIKNFHRLFPRIEINSIKEYVEPQRVGFFNVYRPKEIV